MGGGTVRNRVCVVQKAERKKKFCGKIKKRAAVHWKV